MPIRFIFTRLPVKLCSEFHRKSGILLLLLLQACTTSHYSIDSYRRVNKEIEKNYKLSRADLVLSYDLARIENTNCIYPATLGLVSNEKNYANQYLQKFAAKYKSSAKLAKEAKKKIVRICRLLINLQNQYRILSNHDYHLVRNLSRADLSKLDLRKELAKLDRIITHLPLMLPAYNPCFSSGYGNRKHPINGKYKQHCGVDLVAATKAPIYASAYGKVSFVGLQNSYGSVVEIDHGNGIKTKYAHLKKALVRNGQKIIRGEVIALQGNSGNARGEHLHFEIHIAGKHINPYDFIGHNYTCKK